MRIEIIENSAYVYTEYNKEFVARIKQIGGSRWNAADKSWIVPAESVDTVREFMIECYGESDIDSSDKVDVRIRFVNGRLNHRSGIMLFGRSIAHATGRDSGAVIDKGIELICGEIESGGSRSNWTTEISSGTVIIMRGVNRSMIQPGDDYDYWIIDKSGADKDNLLQEKENLLKRIAEIDSILAEVN